MGSLRSTVHSQTFKLFSVAMLFLCLLTMLGLTKACSRRGPSCQVLKSTTTTTTTSVEGLLISGGGGREKSVEVYVPSTGCSCQLPDLPVGRWGHSMEDRRICGGGNWDSDTGTSCLSLTDEGIWNKTTTMLEDRKYHSSWASPSGLILLGGDSSPRTSEKIGEDGTSRNSFNLNYTTS